MLDKFILLLIVMMLANLNYRDGSFLSYREILATVKLALWLSAINVLIELASGIVKGI